MGEVDLSTRSTHFRVEDRDLLRSVPFRSVPFVLPFFLSRLRPSVFWSNVEGRISKDETRASNAQLWAALNSSIFDSTCDGQMKERWERTRKNERKTSANHEHVRCHRNPCKSRRKNIELKIHTDCPCVQHLLIFKLWLPLRLPVLVVLVVLVQQYYRVEK